MKDPKPSIETPSHRAKRTLSKRVKKVQPIIAPKLSKEEVKLTLDPSNPPPVPFKHINAPEQIRGNVGSGNLSWANTLSITRMTLNGNLSFTNTATEGILGTVTNDSAAAGNVGEYVKSTTATGTAVSFPATGA
jgi:hypothetical protein